MSKHSGMVDEVLQARNGEATLAEHPRQLGDANDVAAAVEE